jgi:tetratricopeptide (TPR) repeat protein
MSYGSVQGVLASFVWRRAVAFAQYEMGSCMKRLFTTRIKQIKYEMILRRLHEVWSRYAWSLIACIVVAYVVAEFNVVAAWSLQEQCFINEGADAREACHAYVEEMHSDLSKIIQLCSKLEEKLLHENAIVVCKQGLLYYPNNKELQLTLQMAESNRDKAKSSKNAASDTGVRASRLASISCLRLQSDKSLEVCQRAVKLDPDNAALYKRLGDVLMEVGRRSEAEQAYLQARLMGLADARPPVETPKSESTAASMPDGKAAAPPSSVDSNTLLLQLQLLDRLRKEGLISAEEYNERKTKLLDTVFKAQPIGAVYKEQPTSPPEPVAPVNDIRKLVDDVKFGNFYALVIGNNAYQHIQKLQSAIADATAVGTLLEKEYGFRVTRLLDASRYQILSALSQLRMSLSKRDNLLIYYAGHGVLDSDIERGYWLPIDAEADNYANWLSTTDLIDQVNGMKALHVMVVADSCFSGTLTRSLPELNQTRNLSIANEDYQALIRRLAKKRSRTVLTSGGLEPVLDSGGGVHSVFAKAFLQTLYENQAIMEGTKLFQKLRELVVYSANQTPEYAPFQRAGHEGGDFIFVRQP